MEYSTILIDTSVIIDYFRKRNKRKTLLFQFYDYNFAISSITVFELLVGASELQIWNYFENILEEMRVLDFNYQTAEKAASLYQTLKAQNKLIGLKDTFIAATALVYDLPVLTLNTKHFSRIPGIKLIYYER